jgi:hypothetical protein
VAAVGCVAEAVASVVVVECAVEEADFAVERVASGAA